MYIAAKKPARVMIEKEMDKDVGFKQPFKLYLRLYDNNDGDNVRRR